MGYELDVLARNLKMIKTSYIGIIVGNIVSQIFSIMAKLSKKQIFKDWIRKIEPLLEVIQDFSSKGKVIKLEKIFDLEEQIREIY